MKREPAPTPLSVPAHGERGSSISSTGSSIKAEWNAPEEEEESRWRLVPPPSGTRYEDAKPTTWVDRSEHGDSSAPGFGGTLPSSPDYRAWGNARRPEPQRAGSVHPHVRGDNGWEGWWDASYFGTPPRAWGQRAGGHSQGRLSRYTPTCVGTTGRDRARGRRGAVHPHVRGDNATGRPNEYRHVGTPPRAWGQRPARRRAMKRVRYTPTCVGTTRARTVTSCGASVHPHVRGDNSHRSRISRRRCGTPPRAWGQRRRARREDRHLRYTPTCVGTTSFTTRRATRNAVHPHVRGDNFTSEGLPAVQNGTPPRAWGQLVPVRQDPGQVRYTPTCVGTTGACLPRCARITVHPHVRGDNTQPTSAEDGIDGTPPRAWGQRWVRLAEHRSCRYTPTCVGTTHITAAAFEGALRYTPTCVGTTALRILRGVQKAVHPHVRGDNFPETGHFVGHGGTPPRAWGQHYDTTPIFGPHTPDSLVAPSRRGKPLRNPARAD